MMTAEEMIAAEVKFLILAICVCIALWELFWWLIK